MSAQSSERCDGQRFSRGLVDAAAWLDDQAAAINALNVFPVPDGDTGTNMSLTLRAAARESAACPDAGIGAVARAAAHGALLGARGNSGVILSQYLRGVARHIEKHAEIGPTDLAQALAQGSATAYKAVIRPVEGTILTVSRGAAQAAVARAERETSFSAVLEAAVDGARESLAKTPSLLPVLKQAGVVDAGGQGLTCILEGLLRSFRGEIIIPERPPDLASMPIIVSALDSVETQSFGYCTEFLLRAAGLDLAAISERIVTLGDSALVVGDGDLVRVHVHTPNPGAVLEYACALGTLHRIKIDNMQDQHEHVHGDQPSQPVAVLTNGAARANGASSPPDSTFASTAPILTATSNGIARVQTSRSPLAMVAVAAGDGFADLFRSLGVRVVVPGGQTMNPSTEELLRAVQQADSKRVLLLPNNSNILMAARQVSALADCETVVVPTHDMAQGIAAALAFEPESDLESNRRSMEGALGSVRTGEITSAVRDARLGGLDIREGQLIGLIGGDVVVVGAEMPSLATDLLERLNAGDAELLTLYRGDSVTAVEAEALRTHIAGTHPGLEIDIQLGGQPLYQYLLSVE